MVCLVLARALSLPRMNTQRTARLSGRLLALGLVFAAPSLLAADTTASSAEALVARMVDTVGSMSDLHGLRDVEYTYVYRTPDGKTDLSVERHLFDGHLSWGRYPIHEAFAMPGAPGEVVMGTGRDGPWLVVNGQRITDTKKVGTAAFLRPTNFYWFAMFQKLQDPGVQLALMSPQTVDGVRYARVKMTFAPQGDKRTDDYILYFNPDTGLVDQFLFTVRQAGITDPLLMKVNYEKIDGIMLPTRRKYAPADWNGAVKKDAWTDQLILGVHFNNGFRPQDFDPPSS